LVESTLGSATAPLLPSKLSYRVRSGEIVLPQGRPQRRQHREAEADQRAARWATTWWRGDGKLAAEAIGPNLEQPSKQPFAGWISPSLPGAQAHIVCLNERLRPLLKRLQREQVSLTFKAMIPSGKIGELFVDLPPFLARRF